MTGLSPSPLASASSAQSSFGSFFGLAAFNREEDGEAELGLGVRLRGSVVTLEARGVSTGVRWWGGKVVGFGLEDGGDLLLSTRVRSLTPLNHTCLET